MVRAEDRKNARTVYPAGLGAVASGVAQVANKHTQQQYNQSQNEADRWQRNASFAKSDENLARQALERKEVLKLPIRLTNLDQQSGQVDTLSVSR